MSFKIIWNDITRERTDAIVTPASRFPRIGAGVDKAIHEAAGRKLIEARKMKGTLKPGMVRETPAYDLAKKIGAKWVIHCIGPIWEGGDRHEDFLLRYTYLNTLLYAKRLGAKVISMPVISSGRFGMDPHEAFEIAVESIQTFTDAVSNMTVKLVILDSELYDYARDEYEGLVESHFSLKEESAYRKTHGKGRSARSEEKESGYFKAAFDRLDRQWSIDQAKDKTFPQLFRVYYKAHLAAQKRACDEEIEFRFGKKPKKRDAKEIAEVRLGFATTMKKFANLMEFNWRNIRNYTGPRVVRPAADTVIALAIQTQISPREMDALLIASEHECDLDTPRTVFVREHLARCAGDREEMNELLVKNGFQKIKLGLPDAQVRRI